MENLFEDEIFIGEPKGSGSLAPALELGADFNEIFSSSPDQPSFSPYSSDCSPPHYSIGQEPYMMVPLDMEEGTFL
jgi:hypothetical protein